jgi:hypothetical protein
MCPLLKVFTLFYYCNIFNNLINFNHLGGFPALIEYLISTKGTVEPVVINHDQDKWNKFLNATGRLIQSNDKVKNGNINHNYLTGNANNNEDGDNKIKKSSELSQLETLQYAIETSGKYNHLHMKKLLIEKVNMILKKTDIKEEEDENIILKEEKAENNKDIIIENISKVKI